LRNESFYISKII